MLPRTRSGDPDFRKAAALARPEKRRVEYTQNGEVYDYWYTPRGKTPTDFVIDYWIESMLRQWGGVASCGELNSLSYHHDKLSHYHWLIACGARDAANGRLTHVLVHGEEDCAAWGSGGFGMSTLGRRNQIIRELERWGIEWKDAAVEREREYLRKLSKQTRERNELVRVMLRCASQPIGVNHPVARVIVNASPTPTAITWDTDRAKMCVGHGANRTVVKRALNQYLLHHTSAYEREMLARVLTSLVS